MIKSHSGIAVSFQAFLLSVIFLGFSKEGMYMFYLGLSIGFFVESFD